MAMGQMHDALIALGSNLGDRAGYLHQAVQALGALGRVVDTSFLYETNPVLLEEQPRFLNAACRLRTGLTPHDLLRGLQQIETDMGRVKTIRYGPRIIDLDLAFYADCILHDAPFLILPHYQATVRDFVLEPLCDMVPEFVNPESGLTLQTHWQQLEARPLAQVFPLQGEIWPLRAGTHVWGILNVSPESELVPDQGFQLPAQRPQFQDRLRQMVRDGAASIDIGAHSTRPGHVLLPVREEVRRIDLAMTAAREVTQIPLSVDTFRAEVAAVALDRGASLINDVWAGRFDPDLVPLATARGVPMVFVHNRLRMTDPGYPQDIRDQPRLAAMTDVAAAVQAELEASLATARAAGQCRWLQVVDPGLGFGKNLQQNVALLHQLDAWTGWKYPFMVGPSHKAFVGAVASDSAYRACLGGSLAAAVMSAQADAFMVRMHDVREARGALAMANACQQSIASRVRM